MSSYEYFLIAIALVFCGYASWTDLKTQKIRNVCSFGLLYGGTLSQLIAWYVGTTPPLYILALFLGSGLLAFGFYWFGIFSPGDSKLFWGVCLMFPASLFRELSGSLSFPPLILALNILVPYSIGVLGYLLFKLARMPNKLARLHAYLMFNFFRKGWVTQSRLLEKLFNLLFFIGIATAFTYLLERFGWQPDRFILLLLVLAAFTFVQKLLSRLPKTPVYYAVVGFASVWVSVQTVASVAAFLTSFAFLLVLYLVVFVGAKQIILGLASLGLEKAYHVESLRVGMIPAEQLVRVTVPDGSVRYEKKQVDFSSSWHDNVIVSPDPTGLDADQIAHLQALAAAGALARFGNQIKIQPAIRFAPVISIGTLLTVLCQGPFYLKLIPL